jgi:hypothetical protein
MADSIKLGEIAMVFLAVRDQLKLYHWRTTQYSKHIASGDLSDKISTHMDKFIEIMQGSKSSVVSLGPQNQIIFFENQNDETIIITLLKFIRWLKNDIYQYINSSDKDLSNIIDEIIGDVNQTLFLFKLN